MLPNITSFVSFVSFVSFCFQLSTVFASHADAHIRVTSGRLPRGYYELPALREAAAPQFGQA